jgi:hypothetical protein
MFRCGHGRPPIFVGVALAVAAVLGLPGYPAVAEELVTVASVDTSGSDALVVRVTVPLSQADTAAADLSAQTGMPASVEVPLKLIQASNDTYRSRQWALDKVTFEDAHTSSTGIDVTVAVVDTGVQAAHPDLVGQVLTGWNTITNTTASADDSTMSHGTHVAGILAALANNSTGITGAAPGIKILPVKVLDSTGSGTWANVAAGIIWACDHGARVINLSLGGGADPVIEAAITDVSTRVAPQKPCLVIAAAGNDSGPVLYPAAYPQPIAVASVNESLRQSYFSNFGSEIDIAAPGSNIYSTVGTSTYGSMSGTSMATPYAAAEAALIMSANPTWTISQVRDQMTATATDLGLVGRDDIFGAGLISPSTALCGHQCLAPLVTAVSPNYGVLAGGSSVTITGSHFTGASGVAFGATAAGSYAVVSDTAITATTPAGTGVAIVSVSSGAGTGSATGAFTFADAPTVTQVAPATGPTSGGTTVTITGTNLTGTTSVTFGGIAATAMTVTSATSIAATTPVLAVGTVDVAVTTPGGTATSAGAFTANAPISASGGASSGSSSGGGSTSSSPSNSGGGGSAAEITEVRPAFGATNGGTRVLILGFGFWGATSVTFGGKPVTEFRSIDAATLEVVTPPGVAGWQDVIVTLAVGRAAALPGYRYVAEVPVIPTASTLSTVTPPAITIVVTTRASRRSTTAPLIRLQAGQPARFVIKGLPRKARMVLEVGAGRQYTSLGSLRTTSAGWLTLPEYSADSSGTRLVRLTDAAGARYYVRLSFRR